MKKKKLLSTPVKLLLIVFILLVALVGLYNKGQIENNEPIEKSDPENIPETLSQKNAVRSAKNYNDQIGMSKDGLIEQLEIGGLFTHEQAVHGANSLDW